MNLPTPKELKKLATACRKAGIKSLKCEGFEFTLADQMPETKTARKKATQSSGDLQSVIDADFESEGLTQDQLINWSVSGLEDETPKA